MKRRSANSRFSSTEALECRKLLTTFEVSPGDSIQAAIDSASDNDTIVLNEGTYDQSVDIQNKSISLIGVGDVVMSGDTLDPSTIGLKAKGGKKITLSNIDFTQFSLPVDIEEVGNVVISDVTATDNGLGVYVSSANKLRVTGLTSSDNGPGGFAVTDVKTAIVSELVANNNGLDGIQLRRVNKAKLTDVTANGNSSNGLDAVEVRSLLIADGEFNGNGGGTFGNGVYINRLGKSAKLSRVTAMMNTDSGLTAEQQSISGKISVLDSVFSENLENGLDFDFVKTVVVNRSTVNDNMDDGLDVDTGGRVIVKSSEFSGNTDDGIDIDNALFKQRNVNAFGNGDQDIEL